METLKSNQKTVISSVNLFEKFRRYYFAAQQAEKMRMIFKFAFGRFTINQSK